MNARVSREKNQNFHVEIVKEIEIVDDSTVNDNFSLLL